MLASTSPKVAECLDKAAQARHTALSAERPEEREFWREMESKWVRLAESYAQADRVSDFTGSKKK
jgi:hypothetical protein